MLNPALCSVSVKLSPDLPDHCGGDGMAKANSSPGSQLATPPFRSSAFSAPSHESLQQDGDCSREAAASAATMEQRRIDDAVMVSSLVHPSLSPALTPNPACAHWAIDHARFQLLCPLGKGTAQF